jgi:hypothetical protein
MVNILSHHPTALGLSIATLLATVTVAVVRLRNSTGSEPKSGCKKCVVCGVEIYGLCSHYSNIHDWCRCIWR